MTSLLFNDLKNRLVAIDIIMLFFHKGKRLLKHYFLCMVCWFVMSNKRNSVHYLIWCFMTWFVLQIWSTRWGTRWWRRKQWSKVNLPYYDIGRVQLPKVMSCSCFAGSATLNIHGNFAHSSCIKLLLHLNV